MADGMKARQLAGGSQRSPLQHSTCHWHTIAAGPESRASVKVVRRLAEGNVNSIPMLAENIAACQ